MKITLLHLSAKNLCKVINGSFRKIPENYCRMLCLHKSVVTFFSRNNDLIAFTTWTIEMEN